MVTPNYHFIFSKKIFKDYLPKNIMNFYPAVFPEKKFLGNIHKKGWFWGTYSLIFTLSGQNYD